MAAQHDRPGIGVRPGNFGDDVEGIARRREFSLDVEFQLHRNVLFEQAGDAIVMLVGHHHRGDRGIFFGSLRAGADHGSAIRAIAGGEQRERAFVLIELGKLGAQAAASTRRARCAAAGSSSAASCRAAAREAGRRSARREAQRQRRRIAADGVGRYLGGGQFGIGEAVGIRGGDHFGIVRRGRQHELAL